LESANQPEWSTSSLEVSTDSLIEAASRRQVNLIVDLGENDEKFWGVMVDLGSKFASEVDIYASKNGITYSTEPLFSIIGKTEKGEEYRFNDFVGRYLKLSFKNVGARLVAIDRGNATTTVTSSEEPETELKNYDAYTLRQLKVFKSPNRALVKGTTATISDRFLHTSEIAVDGNYSQAWLNYPGSTEASLMVNFLDLWEVVGGVYIYWWYPAKDFQVWYSPFLDPVTGLGEWFSLSNFTNNTKYYTEIKTDFVAQYVKIVMTRSAHYDLAIIAKNRGHKMYGVYAINVIFEKNVALAKKLASLRTWGRS
jgi:hypothetical protein